MRAVYKKSTGAYCDNEQSMKRPPDEAKDLIKRLPNVPLAGAKVSDFIVINTDNPSLKKYDGVKLIDDTDKIQAVLTAETQANDKAQRLAELKTKIDSQTATLKELQEYLGG